MNEKHTVLNFLYGNVIGRILLKLVMVLHIDRIIVKFLWSPLSKPLAVWYAAKHGINYAESYSTYREMFVRSDRNVYIDDEVKHLISPCDGWLSYYEIDNHNCFTIKNSLYTLEDLINDENVALEYNKGLCLIFRLCPSDYHHYCYVDDGYQGKHHYIPGTLHSVQPIACEKYPVYVLNKRCWSILESNNFGSVLQCEIGALIVGDIINQNENKAVSKGEEKGYFEIAGSTIVLLFEQGKIKIRSSIEEKLSEAEEMRVTQGEWIASAVE